MKDEIKTLKRTIRDLRLPDYICKGKTPVPADLTLDPDTAYCALILSKSQKHMRLGEKKTADHTATRSDKYDCVLATKGFRSGRHYWELEVNKEFTVGVTEEFSQRKGRFSISPSVGYWCLLTLYLLASTAKKAKCGANLSLLMSQHNTSCVSYLLYFIPAVIGCNIICLAQKLVRSGIRQ
ncbi:hypothetical protein AOLI_G00067140 [Acnodon oligacanthus]